MSSNKAARSRRFLIVSLIMVALAALLPVALWQLSKSTTVQVFGKLVSRVDVKGHLLVALTFDDGPSLGTTPKLLDVLEKTGAKATFFVIGQHMVHHPQIVQRILQEGHELANHSYSHQRMVGKSQEFYRDEVMKTDALIRQAGQRGEILFRPPFGHRLFGLPWFLSVMGKTTVLWDTESLDWETQDPKVLLSNVHASLRSGSIVLFHDGFQPKPGTVETVEQLITDLQSEGFKFVTVTDLLEAGHH